MIGIVNRARALRHLHFAFAACAFAAARAVNG